MTSVFTKRGSLRTVPAVMFGAACLLSSSLSAHAATPDQFALIQAQLMHASAQLQQITAPQGSVLGATTTNSTTLLASLKAQLVSLNSQIASLQKTRAAVVAQIAKLQVSSTSGVEVYSDATNAVFTPATKSGQHDSAMYTIKFDVTAEGDSVYLAKNLSQSVLFTMVNGAGTEVGKASTTATLFSTSDGSTCVNANYYCIPDGTTSTFTLSVKWMPGMASPARALQLSGLKYAATPSVTTGVKTWKPVTTKDFRTDAISTNY